MSLVESFSGVRGVFGKDLTEEVATRYAFALQKVLNPKKVVIGRDTRESGPALKDALCDGLSAEIIDVSVASTPMIEQAVRALKADCGIIITASHNEPEYNGFKFLDKDGAVLRPEQMQRVIETYAQFSKLSEEEFIEKEYSKKLTVKNRELMDSLPYYRKFLANFLCKSKIPIIIDCNGGAATSALSLFKDLNCTVLNDKPGKFAHKIEPDADSLGYLKEEIKKHDAQFAIGFDCDADRAEIILGDGSLVSGNHLLALIADDVLSAQKHPSEQTIVVNDATSYVVKDIAQKYNARLLEVEVGEINVVDAMIDHESPVGGEGSNGGIILPPSRCRDGIMVLFVLLRILAKTKKSLAELIAELPEYTYIKEKITLKESFVKQREHIMQHYLKAGFTLEETGDETGGLKAITDHAWVWFRQSKTEDKVLRVIADGRDENKVKQLLRDALELLK